MPIMQGQQNSDELVLGLDDLLNVSELDNDDENDVRIWRDFNNAQKSRVPLGAFRNKSILHNHHHRQQQQQEEEMPHHHQHSRRTSNSHVQSHPHPSKHNINMGQQVSGTVKRRKSSLGPSVGGAVAPVVATGVGTTTTAGATAGAPGYRSTKSGLFSEAALASVEEMLGDDYDVMALIERL